MMSVIPRAVWFGDVQNIFISHQLNLQIPFASRIVNLQHAKQLRPFSEIWVPDVEHSTYSGELSNPKWIDTAVPIKYIGIKSRLKKRVVKKEYDIAAILSGPEPQRTYLEQKLMEQLSASNLKSIIVQGSKEANPISSTSNVQVLQFADQERLSEIICGSELIICRSGYSTIMDLANLGERALFIPTPGQTEQEYLAKNFEEKQIAGWQGQKALDIKRAWEDRKRFEGF